MLRFRQTCKILWIYKISMRSRENNEIEPTSPFSRRNRRLIRRPFIARLRKVSQASNDLYCLKNKFSCFLWAQTSRQNKFRLITNAVCTQIWVSTQKKKKYPFIYVLEIVLFTFRKWSESEQIYISRKKWISEFSCITLKTWWNFDPKSTGLIKQENDQIRRIWLLFF